MTKIRGKTEPGRQRGNSSPSEEWQREQWCYGVHNRHQRMQSRSHWHQERAPGTSAGEQHNKTAQTTWEITRSKYQRNKPVAKTAFTGILPKENAGHRCCREMTSTLTRVTRVTRRWGTLPRCTENKALKIQLTHVLTGTNFKFHSIKDKQKISNFR